MILLQLSSGQGPIECCKAVGLALHRLQRECQDAAVTATIIEAINAEQPHCFKSVVVKLSAQQQSSAEQLAYAWQGTLLWTCESPYRPKQRRKNWFFSGQVFVIDELKVEGGISYQACRASGAGGQHVNTTDSAIRATHKATGLSVRVESERSQHANKRLAKILLLQKLESQKAQQSAQEQQQRWQQHRELQRGNPVRTFSGIKFKG